MGEDKDINVVSKLEEIRKELFWVQWYLIGISLGVLAIGLKLVSSF